MKVAYQRAMRFGYFDLADELRPKIKPNLGLDKNEVRFLRDLMFKCWENEAYGCEMAEMMDGSGELGGSIWARMEEIAVDLFVNKAAEYGYFPKQILQARDIWLEWESKAPIMGDISYMDKYLLDYFEAHDLWDSTEEGDKMIKSNWSYMRENGLLVTLNEDEI